MQNTFVSCHVDKLLSIAIGVLVGVSLEQLQAGLGTKVVDGAFMVYAAYGSGFVNLHAADQVSRSCHRTLLIALRIAGFSINNLTPHVSICHGAQYLRGLIYL